jgi:hypothetical protein
VGCLSPSIAWSYYSLSHVLRARNVIDRAHWPSESSGFGTLGVPISFAERIASPFKLSDDLWRPVQRRPLSIPTVERNGHEPDHSDLAARIATKELNKLLLARPQVAFSFDVALRHIAQRLQVWLARQSYVWPSSGAFHKREIAPRLVNQPIFVPRSDESLKLDPAPIPPRARLAAGE